MFDPIAIAQALVRRVRALPVFALNLVRFARANTRPTFAFSAADSWFRSFDRYENAGAPASHYFVQDLWAARKLYTAGTRAHVDVGSRIDGFVAHVLTFSRVTYVDVRPLAVAFDGFEFRQGLITALPFDDGGVNSLSSLHVIEHVGLGRYGDPIDPEGPWRAAKELIRVLASGGRLLLGVPTGRERLAFDAHRIFDPQTIRDMFGELELVEFAFIDDQDNLIIDASYAEARRADYGCGLFEFRKR